MTIITLLGCLAQAGSAAFGGGGNVAVIDDFGGDGHLHCQFLADHGYACSVFPKEGPTVSLDPFDVVIDTSPDWSDPTGMLADFMRSGKTVITTGIAPFALGIDSNPTVQAWIGVNSAAASDGPLVTVARDPILGSIPPGTVLVDCQLSVCGAVTDTSGHSGAKILARLQGGPGPIGVMRNIWEGGVSVYMTRIIGGEIFLNSVRARVLTIPTLNAWGLLILGVGVGIAGTVVIRRRAPRASRPGSHLPLLLMGVCLFVPMATVEAEVTSTQDAGVTYLRVGGAEPFHSTAKTVVNLRSVEIPDSVGLLVLWNETDGKGSSEPFYAISLDGKNVNQVRATSYDLLLRYAGFDPAIEAPAVPMSLLAATFSTASHALTPCCIGTPCPL